MKFRFVLLGPDDDPERDPSAREDPPGMSHTASRARRYEQRGAGIVRRETCASGRWRIIPVANFNARIVRDILLDDGEQERREFCVEAELGERKLAFAVSAAEFGRMGWVLQKLGPEAIVFPGQQQHARAAIQLLSGPIRQERIFTHLGWRKHDVQWLYLFAAGAMAADGPLSDVQVQLPTPLQHYQLRRS